MAPAVLGMKVTGMIVKKIAKSAISKRGRGGRRVGSGPRLRPEALGVKGLVRGGLDKLKSEGVKKMALNMFQWVTRGVVDRYPCGFVVEFRPDCSCHIVQKDTAAKPGAAVPRRNVKEERQKSENS